jgi:multidrug efflux pump subunit AcrA (membrane-fusion protein)
MYAEVNLTLSRRGGVLAVPVLAVDRDGDNSGKVMVVGAGNRLENREVALGIETDHLVEVRSGLRQGDQVVLSGRSMLQPGQEVRPRQTSLSASPEVH